MNCAEFEILLCDYLDGTLDAAGRRSIEAHQRECASCAAMARDAAGAVAFLNRAEEVEPPPELLTRIAFAIPREGSASEERAKGLWRRLSRWFQPVLQPRFAMGMAMTILSFSMLGRFAGIEVRQLKPSDLHPAHVWAAVDDKLHRTWDRAVKYYESLRLVYEVQARLQEWSEQDEENNGVLEDSPQTEPGSEPSSEKLEKSVGESK
ncbi:MAG: zf-HC2 domain-containing protein [Bryobacteraceae bacterium]